MNDKGKIIIYIFYYTQKFTYPTLCRDLCFSLIANNTNIFFRTRLFENLRMLPHAPGVQMQGKNKYG